MLSFEDRIIYIDLHHLTEKHLVMSIELHMMFTDLHKAHARVSRPEVWRRLSQLGGPGHFVRNEKATFGERRTPSRK